MILGVEQKNWLEWDANLRPPDSHEKLTGEGLEPTTSGFKNTMIYIKLTQFEDCDSRKLPLKYTYWDAVVFEKWVKQIMFVSVLACKNVLTSYAMIKVLLVNGILHAKIIFVLPRQKLFVTCFTHFSKTSEP